MSDNSASNKRIAKNSILLYVRMFITLIVGLYTSRVILDSLGVEDFGIYNVVGGFVAVFSVLRAGLVSATQRFITFDLGNNDTKELKSTFSTCVIIYIALAVLVVILAESLGSWFVNNKLVIPGERIGAAQIVFQFSVIAFVVSFISFPYNALIIAHEKMEAFAYISIYEVFSKLAVSYIIYIITYDKLIVYAGLIAIVQITVPLLYYLYCKYKFEETTVVWKIRWAKVKSIYSFTGWAMFGGFANIGFTQGLNVLLGMFFTPSVNAARGVAVQIQGVVTQFVGNFQLAIDPQIIKSYAKGDVDYLRKLMFTSSKYSYFLLLFMSLPIMIEADYLLSLWLVEVPECTTLFMRLILVTTMYDAVSNPFGKAIQATGNIKRYQIVVSGLLILILPVSYVFLKLGFDAYSVFIVHIVIGFIAALVRIEMSCALVNIKMIDVVRGIFIPSVLVTLFATSLPLLYHIVTEDSLSNMIICFFISCLMMCVSVWLLGMTKVERQTVKSKIKQKIYNL